MGPLQNTDKFYSGKASPACIVNYNFYAKFLLQQINFLFWRISPIIFLGGMMMKIKELIFKNRSYRKFYEDEIILEETLFDLVDLARLSASSKNLQPLKFILSNTIDRNEHIFSCLGWARHLKTWKGPKEGERPSGFIIIVGDTTISDNFPYDTGIAAQSILLGATELGLGGCMFRNISKDKLRQLLNIPGHLEVLMVIAIGKPKDKIQIDDICSDGLTAYWRDNEDIHHVPKRKLEDLILYL
jgi:nitroreductase